MSQLSYTNFVDGDQPLASGFNTRFLLAINLLNSGVESDNIANSAITAAKISSGAVTTTKLSHPVLLVKSSDIASASTTDLSTATGNVVDITGTTTITAFGTLQSGTVMFLRFTGALTLTHNATSLILPTGANITTAAGDEVIMTSLGSGNWRCANYQRKDGSPLVGFTAATAPAGTVIQVVSTQTGAVSTGSTAIPYDDTIPQNTEGDQYLTLSITPNSSSNKLLINVCINGSTSSQNEFFIALFQDSTANALAVGNGSVAAPGVLGGNGKLNHYMTAGTTSSTTFKVRIGSSYGTFTLNGLSGSRYFGGVYSSSITITEIKG